MSWASEREADFQRYSCQATINLSTPIRQEKVRSFQPPWRTVFIYACPGCAREVRVFANSFRGKTPVPSVGAIRCGGNQ